MQRWNFIQRPDSAAVWSLTLSLLVGISHAWSQDQKVVRIGILTDAMIPWHDSTMGLRISAMSKARTSFSKHEQLAESQVV
jgi:hypothetical protein